MIFFENFKQARFRNLLRTAKVLYSVFKYRIYKNIKQPSVNSISRMLRYMFFIQKKGCRKEICLKTDSQSA